MLTAAEMRYLDTSPHALLLFSSDRVSLVLATLTGSCTAVTADTILAIEFLESLLSDSRVPVESFAADRQSPGTPRHRSNSVPLFCAIGAPGLCDQ